MKTLVHSGIRLHLLVGFALLLAGCSSIGVDPTSQAYKALSAGDYEVARDAFWAMHSKNPDDPFVNLDLAESYQGLGRMDLAGPFYRKVIDDGGDIVPKIASPSEQGKTLAQIACEHLRRGLDDPTAC